MSNELLVEADQHTVELSAHNAVTGEVHLRVGSVCFPDARWNDFLIVLLSWWLQALLDLFESESDCFEFCFMDGPFKARGTLLDSCTVSVEFIEDKLRGERTVMTRTGSMMALKRSLIQAAEETMQTIKAHDWRPNDFDRLGTVLDEAKSKWSMP